MTQFGLPFPGPMGPEAELHFQPLGGNDQAAFAGEIPLSSEEVGRVSKFLRLHGFRITALHNHWTDEKPRLIVLHVWKTGDAVAIAEQVQAALEMTAYQ